MSERDYSRLRPTLRPTGCAFSHEGELADTLLDLMDSRDALAKRIAAIEWAATCKGCGKPLLPENAWMEDGCPCNSPKGCNSPAQADVGEAPAESEWPRYVGPPECSVSGAWANGCILIRFDSASSKGVEIFPSKADKAWYGDWAAMENRRIGMGWKDVPRTEAEARIAAARGEKPQTVVEWAESIGVPFPADTDSHGCPVPPRSAPDDQPPFHVGQVVECVDEAMSTDIKCGSLYTVEGVDKFRMGWEVKVEGIWHFAHRFRAIPAPVEQEPTAGMKAVAAHACLGQGDVGKSFLLRKMVEHIGPELAAKDAEIVKLKADRQDAAEKLRAVIMAVSEYTSSPPHRRDDHSCLLCRMLESPDYKTYRDAPASKEMLNSALKAMGEKSYEVGQLKQQVSSLTAKLVEAEKQRGEDWNTLRNYLRQCGREGDITRPIGAMIRYADDLRSQLSAATAADAEMDRAAEAMGWMDYTRCKLLFGYNSSIEKGWFVDGTFNGVYSTPTDAILAAKAASGTNTGEK